MHGHMHGGVCPAMLAHVAADEGLRTQAMAALDSQVCAELPPGCPSSSTPWLVLADSSERSVECTVFLRGDEPLAVEIGQVVQVRATIGKEYQGRRPLECGSDQCDCAAANRRRPPFRFRCRRGAAPA